MPTVLKVLEKQTAKYTASLQDENGNALAAADLASMTLTLYNLHDAQRQIINNRNKQDVLNTNNVTIDAGGNLTWDMQPADNPIITDSRLVERHRALFEFTWQGGTKSGVHEVDFDVENVEKLT